MNRKLQSGFYLVLLSLFAGAAAEGDGLEARVERIRIEAGEFLQYVPRRTDGPPRVLVLCHGSVAESSTAARSASTFIERWIAFSQRTGLVLVAPIFDVNNYASGSNAPGGSAWGYRALDGRKSPPDAFVHAIVDRMRTPHPDYDGRFYLYGHSAGGQFANHYLAIHPQRLRGVVLSAPAIYAMPDANAPWPLGMGARRRTLQWGSTEKIFEITPDIATLVDSVQLPVAVVIGTDDTARLSNQPQQGGWTRFDRARHYVDRMAQFADGHAVRSGVRLVPVPNVGHSSKRLTPVAQRALEAMLSKRSRAPTRSD